MPSTDKTFLNTKEAAAFLDVSVHTLYRYLDRYPDMPATRLGARWKFHRDKLEAWVLAKGQELMHR